MRYLLAALCLPFLAGCAVFQKPPVVTMDLGTATVLTVKIASKYEILKYIIAQKCQAKTWTEAECAWAAQQDVVVQAAYAEVEKALLNPTKPVDWDKVIAAMETALGVAMRFAK